MSEVVSRCGFRCDTCPAFTGRIKSSADQIKAADGWSKYFGLKMSAEKIRCNGCLSEICVNGELPDSECPIRPCVMMRGMNTCADCFDFPYDQLQTRMKAVDQAIEKFGGKIPMSEYETFIEPYDYRKNLNEIRDRRTDRID